MIHVSELNDYMDYINVIVLPKNIKRGFKAVRILELNGIKNLGMNRPKEDTK